MKETKKSNEVKVKGNDPVEIEYTEKSKFHAKGTRAVVHAMQADKLIAKGVAMKPGKKAKDE